MKIRNIILTAFIGMLLCTSCKKVLDKVDESKGNAGLIFGDSALVKQNIDYIYDQNLPAWYGNDDGAIYKASGGVSGLSDESTGDNKFLQGTLTSADVGDIGTSNDKNNIYGKMRVINTFLRDCAAGSLEAGTKNRFLAQAYFFRAFRYFNLVRVYGGVPLVLTPLSSVGDENKLADQLPRNKTSECIAQIVSDLDSCIKYLPKKWGNTADWGRITSGAAAAFKGRVLLTYASPQFNPTNDLTRWQKAYDASTEAISLLSSVGFGLNPSYQNMWFTEVNNPEAVMVTGYNTSTGTNLLKSNGYDKSVRPAYLGSGSGSSQPTWDFVQLYPMKDGKSTEDLTSAYTYSKQTFYKNRDPRFDATIAYNGCTWPTLGVANYRLWTYLYSNGNGGSTSTEITGGTNTGFYLRKATSPTAAVNDLTYSGTDWMEIRYAEVLLNQAEAAAELGNSDLAYANLKLIRQRAGIDPGVDGRFGLSASTDHDVLINAVMLERAVEFAFEGKRFWDLRRRNMLQSTLNLKHSRSGIIIKLKDKDNSPGDYIASTRNNASLDDLYTNTFEITTKKLDINHDLNWQAKYNFFAIPPSAINSDPSIVQTFGWDNGTFDPLQ